MNILKKIILLLVLSFPIYGWSCVEGTNYGDVSMANLPEQILVNAGSYSPGTILYDSGQVSRSKTYVINCQGDIYAKLAWSSDNTISPVSDGIYTTDVQGIGLRVKVWLNITGEYDGDTNDFYQDYKQHYIGEPDFLAGRPSGFLDSWAGTHYTPTYQLQLVATGGTIASNSSLTLKDPISTVSLKDNSGTMVISQLHITGTTKIKLTPMGCTVGSTALNFPMGSINTNAFNSSTKAGFAQQTLTLSCEPGTNATMRIIATETNGDNPDNSVMALTPGEGVATGVGVQLNINGVPLSLNTNYAVFPSNRTTVSNPGAEASYTIFTDPNNPGGAAASNSLTFTANYYKTASEVTPGRANASGTITFIYN